MLHLHMLILILLLLILLLLVFLLLISTFLPTISSCIQKCWVSFSKLSIYCCVLNNMSICNYWIMWVFFFRIGNFRMNKSSPTQSPQRFLVKLEAAGIETTLDYFLVWRPTVNIACHCFYLVFANHGYKCPSQKLSKIRSIFFSLQILHKVYANSLLKTSFQGCRF